jgi:hypothetical protein
MADLSAVPTEDLLAQLPPGPAVAAPVAAALAPTNAAAPDLSNISTEALLAALPPGPGAIPAAATAPAAVAEPAEPRSFMGDIGHQLGLTARAAITGAAALPAMVSDAVTGPINAGLDAVAGEGNGFRFQKAGTALNNVMDAAGVAQPENYTERVVQDIGSGMASAATGAGVANAVAKAAGPVSKAAGLITPPTSAVQGVAQQLGDSAGMQIASGATSGGAMGITREEGGGELAQGAAGLIGAAVPSIVGVPAAMASRAILRGGASPDTMAANIQTFRDAAGVEPTLGQATGSSTVQAAETGLSNVVGSSGIMVRRGEQQAAAMAKSVQDLTDALAPNASGVDAGEAITRGVGAFRDSVKTTQRRLYDTLDQHLAPDTPIDVTATQQALSDLNADIPGAPNISEFFKNAKIKGIDSALQADMDAAAAASADGQPGTMPYQAIKKLRTLVGNEIADNSLLSDVPRSKWTALYGALSDDLGVAAADAGPQAEQAWSRANTYTSLSLQRLEQLATIVNRDAPEKIFKAATTGMAEGGTTITRLMKSLPEDNRREVAAAVLQRMGRARPGVQNADGDAFSSETFLTNLAAISPMARQALFNTSGYPGLTQKVNALASMAAVRRDGAKVFANPSGTARQSALLGWAGTLFGALASGHMGIVGSALVAPVATNVMARGVTSPGLVKWVANSTRLSDAAVPALLNAAARTESTQPQPEAPLPSADASQPPTFPTMIGAARAMRQAGAAGQPVKTSSGWSFPVVQHFADGGLVQPAKVSAIARKPPKAHEWTEFAAETAAMNPKRELSVDEAAHAAATSPRNDLPEPTDAQKKAGNYAKGHVKLHGLDITIENPAGSVRSGTRPDGSTWSNTMSDHYGYVKRTVGADNEQVDVYLGPDAHQATTGVFIIDQLHQHDGGFDEHKAMIGYPDEASAVAAYQSNFDPGWKTGPVVSTTIDGFKKWLKEADLKKPATTEGIPGEKTEAAAAAAPVSAPAADSAPAEMHPAGGSATDAAGAGQQPDVALTQGVPDATRPDTAATAGGSPAQDERAADRTQPAAVRNEATSTPRIATAAGSGPAPVDIIDSGTTATASNSNAVAKGKAKKGRALRRIKERGVTSG